MISQTELKNLLQYKDGNLYWKVHRKNHLKIGDEAGSLHPTGYKQIGINGKYYKFHRIVYFMFYGYLPKYIDHIDNNPLNNQIENLREATIGQNKQNSKLQKNNTSGIKGVSWDKKSKKWRVNVSKKYFGLYFDKEVACFVADTMRHYYHKQFARIK